MLLEELKSEILEARQKRWEILQDYILTYKRTVMEISTNIPGEDKTPAGTFELFESGCIRMQKFAAMYNCKSGEDAAGYYCICISLKSPEELKQAAVQVEEESEAGRLLDIDIYNNLGEQIGRRELGLPQRKCLACDEPAVHCIRSKNHGHNIITGKVQELLRGA